METEEWIYRIDKECKHNRRYAAQDKDAPIKSIYVDRSFSKGLDILVLTLQPSIFKGEVKK